ncbi:MAG: hypothetical protein EP344_09100 [Bacteroidetes bacterium]|nr:MAG: hypothetical protein EP344_09100 [Bacteroidota bacterium]
MKTRLVLLCTLISSLTLTAQVEWKGGFPGQETNWFCAQNWSDNQIPNDLDNVVIPDRSTNGNFYPVIRSEEASVQSLAVYSGAKLTIQTGARLKVMGFNLPGGALFNHGDLINNGTLEVIEPVIHAVQYAGKGTLIHRRSMLKVDDFVCETDNDNAVCN